MSRKYGPLTRWLETVPSSKVHLSFVDLANIVGELPRSSRVHRTWWGNSETHPHSASWIAAGWVVAAIDLDDERVTFERGEPGDRGRPVGGRDQLLDGAGALDRFVERAGYSSVEAAVAEHAVFLHPDTVAQSEGDAVFPVVRDMRHRGEFGVLADGRRVMFCDNTTAKDAYLWAADMVVGPDIQFNHVWSNSRDPDAFTALWNICCTPAFLAKTTDTRAGVSDVLRFRAFDLFGYHPADEEPPDEPAGYRDLVWAEMPPAAPDLEKQLRRRLAAGPKRRASVAARQIGWLYSDGPDATV